VGGGQIFRTRPKRPWGPPSLLCTGDWNSFPGVKRLGVALTTHTQLAPRLKKEWGCTSNPSVDVRGLFWGEIYLYFYLNPIIKLIKIRL